MSVDGERAPAPAPPRGLSGARAAPCKPLYSRRSTGDPWRPMQLRPRRRPMSTRLTDGSTAQLAEQILFPIY